MKPDTSEFELYPFVQWSALSSAGNPAEYSTSG